MNELRELIARARRRLILEQFLARSVWCLFAALVAAAVAIALPRLVTIENLPARWDAICFVLAIGLGVAAAAIWTLIQSRSPLDAAIEIDRRFALRERVASSLSLSEAERQTPAGQALVKDAIRAAGRIHVDDKFPVRVTGRAWLPLVPAAIAFLLMVFFNPSAATSSLDPNAPAAIAKQINTAAESTRKKIEEQRKEAKRLGLKHAEGLFKKIEVGTKELAEKKNVDRTKAAVKLNDLARELSERRKQLGGKEGLQKRLQNLKSFESSPAGKLAEAMKQGDLDQAAKELEKLAKQISDKKLDNQSKAELAKHIAAMKKELADAASAHQQATDNLQKQLADARQSGDMAKAGDLQQKLDQLNSQTSPMQQLQELANQLGKMQQGLSQNNPQQAANAMKQMAQQLNQMQQQAGESQMLDLAMQQLQAAKDAMACKECQGAGCEKCQSQSMAANSSKSGNQSASGGKPSNGNGQPGVSNTASNTGKPASGIGKGTANNSSSNDGSLSSKRDVQVRAQPGRDSAVFTGTVAGPNIKGEVQAEIQQEMAGFTGASPDPFTTERLPRNRREHAEEYFNLLREGR